METGGISRKKEHFPAIGHEYGQFGHCPTVSELRRQKTTARMKLEKGGSEMFEKYARANRESATLLSLLAVIFVMSVALLFAAPLANAASSQANMGTLSGEVVAVDHSMHNANTVTLRSSQIGQFPYDTMNIFVNSGTKINVCKSKEPLRDMTVGHHAKVTYHEVGGLAVANSISEQC